MKVALPAQKAAWRVNRELVEVMSVVLDEEAVVVARDLKSTRVTEELGKALAGTIVLPPKKLSLELCLSLSKRWHEFKEKGR
jgi:hypothetical protein